MVSFRLGRQAGGVAIVELKYSVLGNFDMNGGDCLHNSFFGLFPHRRTALA